MRRPHYGTPAFRQLCRIIDGAVSDAFGCHPDYLTSKGRRSARESVVKRVAGAIAGYATQKSLAGRPAGARSGCSPARGEAVVDILPTAALAGGSRRRSDLLSSLAGDRVGAAQAGGPRP